MRDRDRERVSERDRERVGDRKERNGVWKGRKRKSDIPINQKKAKTIWMRENIRGNVEFEIKEEKGKKMNFDQRSFLERGKI